jgi:signal transduction histidine kinase
VVLLDPDESSMSGLAPLDAAIKSMPFSPSVVFHPEYLDAVRFSNREHEESVVRYLRALYSSQKVDLVLATGFQGLTFAINHGGEIFGHTPVVFVGVEQSRLDGLRLPPGYAGVTHFDDVRGTLEAALRLQPDTTEVVVVAGTAEFDQYWLRHDREVFDQLASRVHFHYLTGLPMLDLLRELNELKPHTIVYLRALSCDGAGQEFRGSEILDLITRNTNAPLYGLGARLGFVGGRPTGEDDQRYLHALAIVRRILAGEKASDIPIQQTTSRFSYVFDARQLQRWHIDVDRVPAGSLLLNGEPSFWELHRRLVLGVVSFMALESALLAILLIHRARRRKAEALLADRNARLQESEHFLRQLSGQLMGAQEDERRRIARELHDDLNQRVADLGISLSNIKRAVPASMENVRDELSSLQQRLLALSDGLRHVSHELHPGMLELFGLVAALKSHCKEFTAVASMPVELEANCDQPLPPEIALCIYRIAQESLRNVAKHSHATKVQVRLIQTGNLLQLTVTDDGIGFDVQEARTHGGLGLRSMVERVWIVHGAIELTSRPGGGSTLIVTIPVQAPHDTAAPLARTAQSAR